MAAEGIVTLDGDIIGSFELSDDNKISVALNKRTDNIADMLEFATEQGMTLGLMLRPEESGERYLSA